MMKDGKKGRRAGEERERQEKRKLIQMKFI